MCTYVYVYVYIHMYTQVYVYDRCILFWDDLKINIMIKVMMMVGMRRRTVATDMH